MGKGILGSGNTECRLDRHSRTCACACVCVCTRAQGSREARLAGAGRREGRVGGDDVRRLRVCIPVVSQAVVKVWH